MSSFLRNFRLPLSVVNEARAQSTQGPQGGEKPLHQRVAALEEQVRLMAEVLDLLTKPKPVIVDSVKPWDEQEYRSSQAEFYASREAKMAKESET